MCIRWNGAVSEPFCVSNGVRQSGVLSPVLFSVYINGLKKMKKKKQTEVKYIRRTKSPLIKATKTTVN